VKLDVGLLDSFVDKDGRGVSQLMADIEQVAEAAWTDTDDAALKHVERRQTSKYTVRLTTVTWIQIVAGL